MVWHHALANCQDWPEFEKIAGAKFWLNPGGRNGVKIAKSGTGGGKVKMHIEDPNHPITKGQADFDIHDETYTFAEDSFSRKNVHVLTSIDYGKMSDAAEGCAMRPGL